MKITIICVGKIKERFYREALEEYGKRLGRYCRLEVIEVSDEKTPDGAGAALEEQIREKEGKRILEKIREDMLVCIPGNFRKAVFLGKACCLAGRSDGKGSQPYYLCDWRFPGLT